MARVASTAGRACCALMFPPATEVSARDFVPPCACAAVCATAQFAAAAQFAMPPSNVDESPARKFARSWNRSPTASGGA